MRTTKETRAAMAERFQRYAGLTAGQIADLLADLDEALDTIERMRAANETYRDDIQNLVTLHTEAERKLKDELAEYTIDGSERWHGRSIMSIAEELDATKAEAEQYHALNLDYNAAMRLLCAADIREGSLTTRVESLIATRDKLEAELTETRRDRDSHAACCKERSERIEHLWAELADMGNRRDLLDSALQLAKKELSVLRAPTVASCVRDRPQTVKIPEGQETQDQVAAIMLLHGTPNQQSEALSTCAVPGSPLDVATRAASCVRERPATVEIPEGPKAVDGVALIAAERIRQIVDEGRTAEHDAAHQQGELLRAASCYMQATRTIFANIVPAEWPWDREWWKPKLDATGRVDTVRNLVVAGALIAAEIDRLRAVRPSVVKIPEPKIPEAEQPRWPGARRTP